LAFKGQTLQVFIGLCVSDLEKNITMIPNGVSQTDESIIGHGFNEKYSPLRLFEIDQILSVKMPMQATAT
jgi:hypothetical protein